MDTRWGVLVCCCFIVFFASFFDLQPTILVQRLTGIGEACASGTDVCLNFSVFQFSIIASIDAWARAIAAVSAGLLIDQYGTKHALWVCSGTVFASTLLFTLGAYAKTITGAYAAMLTGRLFFGFATGAYAVILHRVKAGWFMYKELALAFSIEIFIDQMGTAVLYVLYGGVVEPLGLRGCLWLGFGFSLITAGTLILVAHLDKERSIGMDRTALVDTRPRTIWRSFRSFDVVYWLIIALFVFYEGSVQTFINNGPLFFAMTYGLSESVSSYITGIIYDLCILAPIAGWLTDRYGRRQYSYSLFGAMSLVLLAFILILSFRSSFPPALLTVIIGLGYNVYSPLIWSSIPLLVAPHSVGLGLGIAKFSAGVSVASNTAGAGAILSSSYRNVTTWQAFLVFLVVLSSIGVAVTVAIIILNARTGHRLSKSQQEKMAENDASAAELRPLKTNF